MPTEDQIPAAGHIQIPGDVLIPDQEFRDQVLLGATDRTGRELDAKGLPYIFIKGRKYRPLNEGRAWLAGQIVRRATTETAAA